MKQLLIVSSPTAFSSAASPIDNGLTSHDVKDLSGLKEGAIAFFELGEDTSKNDSMPLKNFGIALGRPNGQLPFVIPEVDVKTLTVTKALPKKGTKYSCTFTMPTTVAGKEYTLRFFKKGTVPHERNTFTVSIVAKTTTAATEGTALVNAIKARTNADFNITASIDTAAITISANDWTDWNIIAYDSLAGTSLTQTNMEKNIGDKAFIEQLASMCAAGKGFRDTDYEGREYLPGYPEKVADFTLNTSGTNGNGLVSGCSTSGYALYTLRFKVGREAAKTRDERVWQVVHIAIPVDSNGTYYQIRDLDKIIPAGDYAENLAKAVADAEVKTLVNSTYLA